MNRHKATKPLAKDFAYALYVLLCTDSTSRNFILTGQLKNRDLTKKVPRRAYHGQENLRQALNEVIAAHNSNVSVDFDDDLSLMLDPHTGVPNLDPAAIHRSFDSLESTYDNGSCPREQAEEQALWDNVRLAANSLVTG